MAPLLVDVFSSIFSRQVLTVSVRMFTALSRRPWHGALSVCKVLHTHRHRSYTLLVTLGIIFILLLTLYQHGQKKDSFPYQHVASERNKVKFLRENENQREYIDKHGVHVIVGQYMGKGFPWVTQPNLTDEVLNMNQYSPIGKHGENGYPVFVPDSQRSRAKQLFFVNHFNLVVSDMISVNRSLPDQRKLSCRKKIYQLNLLPDTSVIIVFHNEAWSTLVRTVHSVLNRSPRQLLRQIILVDDASERSFLKDQLDQYMSELSKQNHVNITIIRAQDRIGLIRARILGATNARGQVLTFLDAHCEVTTGWLQPLLHRISTDRQTVVCPVIDIINDHTFAYARSFDLHWGAINWGLSFRWFSVGRRVLRRMHRHNYDRTAPYPSPIMAGGLFSIDRRYFFEMGAYDEHLEIWGGENIEMSFRIWMCKGRVEIVPCSHVGHLFRSSSPYNFGKSKQVGNVLYANLVRVAEVWLDQWKHFFYKLNPAAAQIVNSHNRSLVLVNITERIELRKRLGCNNFEWFLDNIWPENFFPNKHTQFGQIQSLHNKECLQRPSNGVNPTGKVITAKCSIEIYGPQSFVMPLDNKAGYFMTDESVCLDVNSPTEHSSVLLITCSEFDRQKWIYQAASQQIVHAKSSLCLTLEKHGTYLTLRKCFKNSPKQAWALREQNWTE